MNATLLREKLHEYINTADAIYVLVGDEIPMHNNAIYDEATMNMLYQRRENHRKGISKSYSAEESINLIRLHKK